MDFNVSLFHSMGLKDNIFKIHGKSIKFQEKRQNLSSTTFSEMQYLISVSQYVCYILRSNISKIMQS